MPTIPGQADQQHDRDRHTTAKANNERAPQRPRHQRRPRERRPEQVPHIRRREHDRPLHRPPVRRPQRPISATDGPHRATATALTTCASAVLTVPYTTVPPIASTTTAV